MMDRLFTLMAAIGGFFMLAFLGGYWMQARDKIEEILGGIIVTLIALAMFLCIIAAIIKACCFMFGHCS